MIKKKIKAFNEIKTISKKKFMAGIHNGSGYAQKWYHLFLISTVGLTEDLWAGAKCIRKNQKKVLFQKDTNFNEFLCLYAQINDKINYICRLHKNLVV